MEQNMITLYLRTSNKRAHRVSIQKSDIAYEKIEDIIQQKIKVKREDIIMFYVGKMLDTSDISLSFTNKSILHIVDRRNAEKENIEIYVKVLVGKDKSELISNSRTSPSLKFEVQSNKQVGQFLEDSLVKSIESAENVSRGQNQEKQMNTYVLVYLGKQMNLDRTFREQYVEDRSEIICMKEDSSANRLKRIITKGSEILEVNQKVNYGGDKQKEGKEQSLNLRYQNTMENGEQQKADREVILHCGNPAEEEQTVKAEVKETREMIQFLHSVDQEQTAENKVSDNDHASLQANEYQLLSSNNDTPIASDANAQPYNIDQYLDHYGHNSRQNLEISHQTQVNHTEGEECSQEHVRELRQVTAVIHPTEQTEQDYLLSNQDTNNSESEVNHMPYLKPGDLIYSGENLLSNPQSVMNDILNDYQYLLAGAQSELNERETQSTASNDSQWQNERLKQVD